MVVQTQITLDSTVSVEAKASQKLAPLYIAQFALTTTLNIYTTGKLTNSYLYSKSFK